MNIYVEGLERLGEKYGFKVTREDFTPKIVIDPEDWQEIAGINNAYDDKRYVS